MHATLSSTFVSTAACPTGKAKTDYYDNTITGFILEVRTSGGKTYIPGAEHTLLNAADAAASAAGMRMAVM